MIRQVSILGATGSVGRKAAQLVAGAPDRFATALVTANRDAAALADIARATKARRAVVARGEAYGALKQALAGTDIEVAAGRQALIEAAGEPADVTVAAIVGATGLAPTMAAVRRGGVIALANKEALVCAGPLLTDLVARSGATLLPVDSEHNAIFQVLGQREAVARLILTASGGPFWRADLATMRRATPGEAVAHPVWSMGAKISVDSATMMNKGLEIIEAAHLFDMPHSRIDVLVHPQAVVHSMVEYCDGSVLAQMGTPDMATPIAYALSWPDRMPAPADRLDLTRMAGLTFAEPDPERFPALDLARGTLDDGAAAPIVLNAVNEVAVAAFLEGRIGLMDIVALVKAALDRGLGPDPAGLDEVLHLDGEARRLGQHLIDYQNEAAPARQGSE